MLLHHDGVVKLCDAAIAAQPSEEVCWYMAPEVFDGMPDVKSDVWLLGFSLIRMMGVIPHFYTVSNDLATGKGHIKLEFDEDANVPKELVDFLQRCIQKKDDRWSVKELMDVSEME